MSEKGQEVVHLRCCPGAADCWVPAHGRDVTLTCDLLVLRVWKGRGFASHKGQTGVIVKTESDYFFKRETNEGVKGYF